MAIDHNISQIPTSSRKRTETRNAVASLSDAKADTMIIKATKYIKILKGTILSLLDKEGTIGGTNTR